MAKIGLVLSGGGVRGFAHLGLLQALDEWGIKPYAISGVSAGAIIGALYAAGHKPEKILAFLKANSYFRWSNFLWNKDGFFSMSPLLELLQEQIPRDSFKNLSTRLFITATDYTRNKSVTFEKGSLSRAVIASSSVPVIFEPVEIGNGLFVDGGLLNNFPIEPLESICDKLIGCHTNNIQTWTEPVNRIGKAHIIDRCFHMAIANTVYGKAKHCDLFIEPLLHPFSLFDVKNADKIYEIGYKSAIKYKNQLGKLLT